MKNIDVKDLRLVHFRILHIFDLDGDGRAEPKKYTLREIFNLQDASAAFCLNSTRVALNKLSALGILKKTKSGRINLYQISNPVFEEVIFHRRFWAFREQERARRLSNLGKLMSGVDWEERAQSTKA